MFDKAMNSTLSQDIVAQLSKMILEGTFKKGQFLPSEAKLCEQFGVSRTPVRSALKILSQRKIIETKQGRGSVVISDSFPYLNDGLRAKIAEYKSNFQYAASVRRMLEPQIAFQAACTRTEKDVEDLERILEICVSEFKEPVFITEGCRMDEVFSRQTRRFSVAILTYGKGNRHSMAG